MTVLCSKITNKSNGTNHSILYLLLCAINTRKKTIEGSKKYDLSWAGAAIDECTNALCIVSRFYSYQTRLKMKNLKMATGSSHISEAEFTNLVTQEEIPLAIICAIMRTLRLNELNITNIRSTMLYCYWEKIFANMKFNTSSGLSKHFRTIDPPKINAFIHSDFYFYFWMCDIPHLCEM